MQHETIMLCQFFFYFSSPEDIKSGKGDKENADRERFFRETLDANSDGNLDLEEITDWVDPVGFVQAKSEVVYLMQLMDSDNSLDLSPEEIMSQPQAFLASQVTQYGQIYSGQELRRKVFQFPNA